MKEPYNSGLLARCSLGCVSSRKLFCEELSYLIFQIYCLLAASKGNVSELRLPPSNGPSALVVLLFFVVVFSVPESCETRILFFAVGLDVNKFATFHMTIGVYIAHVVSTREYLGEEVSELEVVT